MPPITLLHFHNPTRRAALAVKSVVCAPPAPGTHRVVHASAVPRGHQASIPVARAPQQRRPHGTGRGPAAPSTSAASFAPVARAGARLLCCVAPAQVVCGFVPSIACLIAAETNSSTVLLQFGRSIGTRSSASIQALVFCHAEYNGPRSTRGILAVGKGRHVIRR